MAQEIKRKIVLEGEKEFSAALREAQRNLKTLRSELKAETAELGSNATAQQKAETRARSLQKQIAEQEKIVKTLQAALAQAKEQYGDNEDVVAKWEQKLNDARATLANMKNDLSDASQAVKETGSSFRAAANGASSTANATKNASDALNSMGSIGEKVSGAIEGAFLAMIAVVTGAVYAMFDLVSDTAAKVNGWEDIAGYWGTDTQTIQQYARAVQAAGNSFEDLNSAVSKLVLGGKGEKITELLGISGVNYENEWDYAIAAMNRMYELRESGQDMNPIFEEIFGEKKSTKIMDLLNDWQTITGLLQTFNEDEGGFGLTSDALGEMSALHVQISTVEEKWTALKDEFAAGLGTATGKVLVSVEGALDALNDYLKAGSPEEKEAALSTLRTNVENFFRSVGEILSTAISLMSDVGESLKESEDPYVALIGNILTGLTGAFQWMIDNQEAVKAAFSTIFGVWLVAKIAAAAGTLANILNIINTIKSFTGHEAASAAQAAQTAMETGGAAAQTAMKTGGAAAQASMTTGGTAASTAMSTGAAAASLELTTAGDAVALAIQGGVVTAGATLIADATAAAGLLAGGGTAGALGTGAGAAGALGAGSALTLPAAGGTAAGGAAAAGGASWLNTLGAFASFAGLGKVAMELSESTGMGLYGWAKNKDKYKEKSILFVENMEELKAEADRRAAEEEAAREKAERDAIA